MTIKLRNESIFEATPEELAGLGKNRRFDEAVDDDENEELQVICKRGDEEVQIARPSRAFYFGDRNLYDQEARRFDQQEASRILSAAQFPRNLARFEELKHSCKKGFVIPFVGAGMSKSAGCPDWKSYLLGLCRDTRLDVEVLRQRIDIQSDYEGVMNDILDHLGQNRFNLDFERDFRTPEDIEGAVALLPQLFDRCAITTNFDRVLETVYADQGKRFAEKVTGLGQASAFFRAIPAGDRYLLKLHGNLDNGAERVLSRAEYESAYGNDGNIRFDFPLPKLLKRLFSSYSFLFLGCSLAADRTITTFMRIAQAEGAENLPHHYALLPCPDNPDDRTRIDQRTADAHITPIWYPDGEHQMLEEILELLLD
jgi:hypothetical protein